MFVFAALLSLVSGLIFGALPAFRQPSLEVFSGWRATSLRRTSIRDALVTLQIAGSLIMLTTAGLMLRTLWKLESAPLGIDAEHLVTAQFTFGSGYDSARLRAFSETLEQRLHNQPASPALPSPTLFLPAASPVLSRSSPCAWLAILPLIVAWVAWFPGALSLRIISRPSTFPYSKAGASMVATP